jgi:hypothetical protein
MDTRPESDFGISIVGIPKIQRTQLVVTINVLPLYATEILDRIRNYNRPLREIIVNARGGWNKYLDDVNSRLIDEPMFYDDTYGFSIGYPSRVPSKAEDSRKLMEVLTTISRDWKSYNANTPDVTDELRRRLTGERGL